MQLGSLTGAVEAATTEALTVVPRIWERDHTVWGPDPTELADRLGWLDADERAEEIRSQLERSAAALVDDGITDVLLVGMGGSSLYPEVLATTFGPEAGFPTLHVLDSTDPAAVLAAERDLPWETTVVVPASKSGSTIEMACLLDRFRARLQDVHGGSAGRFVLPITDPGSRLEAQAAAEGFREVIHGQVDVGGRFSALTPFGLLPAAILGLDLQEHLAAGRKQLAAARSLDPQVNDAAALGAVMAAAVRDRRDKLTLLLPDEIASFGLWIEQLVAESTGKHGIGLLPIVGEDPTNATFGDDRIVVSLGRSEHLETLIAAGVPVVELAWSGPAQLSGEVIRWEFATAVAGALLGINPFDQPDVEAAKKATSEVLDAGEDLPDPEDPAAVLGSVSPGNYIALLAFVTPEGDNHRAVDAAAERLRRDLGVPVTVGVGPRYLHSTGQLHKGGPNNGVFLVVVGDDPQDADIPGRDLTFSRLKRAQAAGDLRALQAADRRALLVSVDALRSVAT
ncbi:MAG: glucose-6-phosphate isomerase [Nitriliruptor sp.]|nr:MAG: glucose-6-phosphate isomerase [Nitriliruptor sp.]